MGGHNVHGHVERVIKSVQELLKDGGLKQQRLHATGLQTLLKLVENNYNSLPIGYSYDRSCSNILLFLKKSHQISSDLAEITTELLRVQSLYLIMEESLLNG